MGIVGFTPRKIGKPWTVRRCPIHELVPADEPYCPVLLEHDSTCGLDLSEPFEVIERASTLNHSESPADGHGRRSEP